ncbi:MAG: Spy/CpxP family protein refolding chaperone [Bacteroidales bacterium]
MNMFNNNRFVFWILIFLVLINLSALATYFIYIRKPASETIPSPVYKSGVALKEELDLAPDQSLKVNQINAVYQATCDPVVKAIRNKKAEMLEELSKEVTDTSLVVSIAQQVVNEQEKLQLANIKQFLDLKKVCTPEQTKKLSQIYAELYGCENKGMGKGNGKGNGKGFRHRYGQKPDKVNQ